MKDMKMKIRELEEELLYLNIIFLPQAHTMPNFGLESQVTHLHFLSFFEDFHYKFF